MRAPGSAILRNGGFRVEHFAPKELGALLLKSSGQGSSGDRVKDWHCSSEARFQRTGRRRNLNMDFQIWSTYGVFDVVMKFLKLVFSRAVVIIDGFVICYCRI